MKGTDGDDFNILNRVRIIPVKITELVESGHSIKFEKCKRTFKSKM